MSSPNEARTWRTPGCFKDFQSFQSCVHAAEGWNTPILWSVWNRMFLSWFTSACFMQKLCPWTCSLFLSKKTRLLCGVLEKKNLRFWKRIHGGYSLGSAVAVTVFDALIPIASSWENFSGLQRHYLFPKDDRLISLQWWLLKFFSSQFLTQRLNIIIKKLFSEEILKINKNTISNFLGHL